MKRKKGSFPVRLSSGESGQAFIIVLVFLVLGALTLVPTLTHIGTALKTGEIYEKHTNEIYAADAGIEDALWQIKYDGLESIFKSPYYNYIFSANASYLLDDPVNGFSTNVTISNVWTPSNVPWDFLTPAQYKDVIERDITDNTTNRLVISGTPIDAENFRIKIDYYPSDDVADNLSVSSIGIWLPSGFSYNGDCNLATFPDSRYKYTETTGPSPGGSVTVWDFSGDPLRFTDLPPEGLSWTNNPQTAEITFQYTGGTATDRPNGVAWIVTADALADYYYPFGGGVPISWDIDTRLYKIVSVAGDTEVEAYTSRSEMRNMYVSTPGDYVAIGNSLMTDETYPKDGKYRDYLWPSSTTTLSGLPDDAYVSHAYLYWSGFFSSGFSTAFWGPDGCTNFNNWDRGTQTRNPNSDVLPVQGTWSTTPASPATYNDKVSDSSDGTYITGTALASGSARNMFTFPVFSIPSGATIDNLTVYFRARDASSGVNNICASIKINTNYYNGSSVDPTSSWPATDYSYSWTTNPAGGAWTAAAINSALTQFGVYSNDLTPNVQVSKVYAVVTYSCWTISSSQFRGYGGGTTSDAARTLTLKTAQNLSARPPGSTIVEWEQGSSNNLEGEGEVNRDRLRFQFWDGVHLQWSEYFTAFTGTLASSSAQEYYYYIIPEAYLTSQFKIRFYLDGFNESNEYCYIDNIALATITGTPDTTADFTIDGYDTHTETVNALVSQLIGNKEKGQYSYSCWQDVTDLVNAHSDRNAKGQPIGNAVYTVGGVNATPAGSTYELAYAGWSLVVIYHSESTAGRQLYLWNYFSYSKGNENLDFDRDGSPGGTIKGFLVPHRIGNESEAAKLTAFVGEGDNIYSGDQLIFNGTALNDGYGTTNVWNSKSVGMSKDGVDIDTFHVLWDDGILLAGDTQAQIDLPTLTDNFNLIYLILSVRSKTTVGGTTHYVIRGV
jgi:hypothetical protein